ncbi:hypothetical protein CPB83DRAFT_854067 [Crepidotus variabilis]|uniref:Uncharacterized protein n=1 Tax=Crepidotus variabilis TaxID=179855 RepID=A0A9P6EGK4_9AGAR|nr:hypothetical protein CPB83DRAFT_854067 [Crepidotus variabilis]
MHFSLPSMIVFAMMGICALPVTQALTRRGVCTQDNDGTTCSVPWLAVQGCCKSGTCVTASQPCAAAS